VMVRGLERRRLFYDSQDYQSFLDRFSRIIQEGQARCYAWALMPNHVHLFVRTGQEALSKWVQRLLSGYGQYFNLRRKRVGYVYGGRFKSLLCEKDVYFLEIVRYVHLNPLRGSLVTNMGGLARYRWCGHGAILGIRKNNWQAVDGVLSWFGSGRAVARRSYLEFVREGIKSPAEIQQGGIRLVRSLKAVWTDKDLAEPIRRRIGEEKLAGEATFIQSVIKKVQEQEDRREKLRRKGWTPGRVMARAEAILGLKKGEVRGNSKRPAISKARSLACKWMVDDLGMTTVATAHRLRVMQSVVSHRLPGARRLEKEMGVRLEGKPSRPNG